MYFDSNPDSKKEVRKINGQIFDLNLDFFTSNDVFSKTKIDERSKLLIENCIIQPNSKILDLGCGWGAVGISLLRKYTDESKIKSENKQNRNINITFSDINNRALDLTRKNLKLNGFEPKNYQIIESDAFENLNEEMYDNIIFNPPIMTGKENVTKILKQSFDHLNPKGMIQIVCNIKVEGVGYKKVLEEVYGNCLELVNKENIVILISRKK